MAHTTPGFTPYFCRTGSEFLSKQERAAKLSAPSAPRTQSAPASGRQAGRSGGTAANHVGRARQSGGSRVAAAAGLKQRAAGRVHSGNSGGTAVNGGGCATSDYQSQSREQLERLQEQIRNRPGLPPLPTQAWVARIRQSGHQQDPQQELLAQHRQHEPLYSPLTSPQASPDKTCQVPKAAREPDEHSEQRGDDRGQRQQLDSHHDTVLKAAPGPIKSVVQHQRWSAANGIAEDSTECRLQDGHDAANMQDQGVQANLSPCDIVCKAASNRAAPEHPGLAEQAVQTETCLGAGSVPGQPGRGPAQAALPALSTLPLATSIPTIPPFPSLTAALNAATYSTALHAMPAPAPSPPFSFSAAYQPYGQAAAAPAPAPTLPPQPTTTGVPQAGLPAVSSMWPPITIPVVPPPPSTSLEDCLLLDTPSLSSSTDLDALERLVAEQHAQVCLRVCASVCACKGYVWFL